MQAAPVTLFIYDSEGRSVYEPMSPADRIHEMSNVQAIGAAIQNMALAAWDMGIGSLWNGNIFFAYDELKEWLGEPGENHLPPCPSVIPAARSVRFPGSRWKNWCHLNKISTCHRQNN